MFAAYVDSNSEESDSDLSDVGVVDSDVEKETQVSYGRTIYKEDLANKGNLLKSSLPPGAKRKTGPSDSLKLEYIHGLVFFVIFKSYFVKLQFFSLINFSDYFCLIYI